MTPKRLTSKDGEKSEERWNWRGINAASAADVSAGDEDGEQ